MENKKDDITFADCETVLQVEARYKKLSKQYHPDAGGSHDQFISVTDLRDRQLKIILKGEGFEEPKIMEYINDLKEHGYVFAQQKHVVSFVDKMMAKYKLDSFSDVAKNMSTMMKDFQEEFMGKKQPEQKKLNPDQDNKKPEK